MSFQKFVNNCFIDINNCFIDADKNLPNVFLRKISEINSNNDKSKIAYILKACWMSKGGGGGSHQIRTMTDKGERRVKESNILPDVLCELPLTILVRCLH